MGVLKVKQADGTWRKVGCQGVESFSDDFNRADGALGTSSSGVLWTSETGAPVISANRLRSGGGAVVAKASVPLGAGPQTATIKLHPLTTSRLYLRLLMNIGDDGYYCAYVTNASGFFAMDLFRDTDGPSDVTATAIPINTARTYTLSATTVSSGGDDTVTMTLTDDTSLSSATRTAAYTGTRLAGGTFGVAMVAQPVNNLAADNLTATANTPPGLLKLWTGSAWVVEKCAGSTGTARPLKVLVDGIWTDAACMVLV